MKGWRTILVNFGIAAGSAVLQYATTLDWTKYVSPEMAVVLVGVANIGLRLVTTTPVGKRD